MSGRDVLCVYACCFTFLDPYCKLGVRCPTGISTKKKKKERVPSVPSGPILFLPQTVAETFESATLLFTTVVDFRAVTKKCSALEVVQFLNTLYNVFDERMDAFDVYKVETISDSYLVRGLFFFLFFKSDLGFFFGGGRGQPNQYR